MATNLISFKDCPIGLFMYDDMLCFKTGDDLDAYIVSTGEYFWGSANNRDELLELLVSPVSDTTLLELERYVNKHNKQVKLKLALLAIEHVLLFIWRIAVASFGVLLSIMLIPETSSLDTWEHILHIMMIVWTMSVVERYFKSACNVFKEYKSRKSKLEANV